MNLLPWVQKISAKMLMTYAVGPKYLDFLENEKLHLFLGAKFNSKTHLLTPFLKTF
jgi:hypothetical protein